jgi:hypothetical protein
VARLSSRTVRLRREQNLRSDRHNGAARDETDTRMRTFDGYPRTYTLVYSLAGACGATIGDSYRQRAMRVAIPPATTETPSMLSSASRANDGQADGHSAESDCRISVDSPRPRSPADGCPHVVGAVGSCYWHASTSPTPRTYAGSQHYQSVRPAMAAHQAAARVAALKSALGR